MKINKTSIALSVLISHFLVCLVSAQAPQLLNYQGRLTNKDGTPASGTKFIVFSIYPDTLPNSKALWFEDRNITVMNGMFNILLGSVRSLHDTLFTSSGNRYLAMKVDGTEMWPRFRLTSVPYSLHANSANLALALVGPPVAGRWYATNHNALGPVNYEWGKEVYNTNPAFLSLSSNKQEIEVKKSGYYVICANVLQFLTSVGEHDIRLRRNSDDIAFSLGFGDPTTAVHYKHSLTIVEFFEAGDKISVYCEDGKVYGIYPGHTGQWSSLEIYKLN